MKNSLEDAEVVYKLAQWAKTNFANGCTEKQLANILLSEGKSEVVISQIFAESKKVVCDVTQQHKKATSLLRLLAKLHHQNPKNLIVEKINTPSKEDFFANYWTENKPVVFKNFTSNWGVLEKWSPDNLALQYGNTLIEVQTNREQNRFYELDSIKHKTKMLFKEYIQLINSVDESNDFYMTANNQVFNTTKFGELLKNISNIPDFLNLPSVNNCWHLWIGPKGTITPLHHDENFIIHAQIRGRKKWKLISPLHFSDVYNNLAVFSKVDIENIDYEAFPLMRNVNVLEVIVEPGEAIFIPLGWWHGVVALDEVVSLSTVDFIFDNKWKFENPRAVF